MLSPRFPNYFSLDTELTIYCAESEREARELNRKEGKCENCGKKLANQNCTLIKGTCNGCLGDEEAEYRNSYHSYEY